MSVHQYDTKRTYHRPCTVYRFTYHNVNFEFIGRVLIQNYNILYLYPPVKFKIYNMTYRLIFSWLFLSYLWINMSDTFRSLGTKSYFEFYIFLVLGTHVSYRDLLCWVLVGKKWRLQCLVSVLVGAICDAISW